MRECQKDLKIKMHYVSVMWKVRIDNWIFKGYKILNIFVSWNVSIHFITVSLYVRFTNVILWTVFKWASLQPFSRVLVDSVLFLCKTKFQVFKSGNIENPFRYSEGKSPVPSGFSDLPAIGFWNHAKFSVQTRLRNISQHVY